MSKRLISLVSFLPLLTLVGCKSDPSLSKEDFLKEYEIRLENYKKLGEIYKSATVGKNSFVKSPIGKYDITSTSLEYVENEGTKICSVYFYILDKQTTSVAAASGVQRKLIENGITYWNKVCNKMEFKNENDILSFAGYLDNDLIVKLAYDKNCYAVEQYMYTYDYSFSATITYNK